MKEEKNITPELIEEAEIVQLEATEEKSLLNNILGFLKSALGLVWKFIMTFLRTLADMFQKLGFVGSLILIVLFVLAVYFSYSIGYSNGEAEALDNLAETYNIQKEGILELLEQASRTFGR